MTVLGLKAAGIDIQPWNAGVGGNVPVKCSCRLQRDVLANKPDWVLLNCGVNDSNQGEYGVSADEFRAPTSPRSSTGRRRPVPGS